VFVIILQEDKVKKGKKIGLPAKKRHNFLMKRIIRICRHTFVSDRSDSVLSEFQPICLPLEIKKRHLRHFGISV